MPLHIRLDRVRQEARQILPVPHIVDHTLAMQHLRYVAKWFGLGCEDASVTITTDFNVSYVAEPGSCPCSTCCIPLLFQGVGSDQLFLKVCLLLDRGINNMKLY